MTKFEQLAEQAQNSIDYFYLSKDKKQWLNNVYPLTDQAQNETFHYWWMAHLIDVRIDAYLRTKNEEYLRLAEETY
ncbi:glycoside hydrolase, partial [Enterococcus durans]